MRASLLKFIQHTKTLGAQGRIVDGLEHASQIFFGLELQRHCEIPRNQLTRLQLIEHCKNLSLVSETKLAYPQKAGGDLPGRAPSIAGVQYECLFGCDLYCLLIGKMKVCAFEPDIRHASRGQPGIQCASLRQRIGDSIDTPTLKTHIAFRE
nr:hypothetical protein [uncultured bacterium]